MTALTYHPGIAGPVVRPLSMSAGGAGTTQVLTAALSVPDGAGLNLTAGLVPAAGTLLMFRNTGAERLLVTAGGDGITVTVDIGARILGQVVIPFPAVTLTAGDTYQFGPFHSVLQIPGTSTVQVTLSAVTGVRVAVTRTQGVT